MQSAIEEEEEECQSFYRIVIWRFLFSFLVLRRKVRYYSPSRDITYQTIVVHLLLAHSSTCTSMFEGYLDVGIGG